LETTPNLDALSREGMLFGIAVVQAPWTKPSVASFFTSTYASTHGCIKEQPGSFLTSSLITIAEVLEAHGYYTLAVNSNPHLKPGTSGWDQGFHLMKHTDTKPGNPERLTDEAIALLRGISALLEKNAEKRFFLYLFYFDPHYPFEPAHKRFTLEDYGPLGGLEGKRRCIVNYDNEIVDTDAAVGRLLAELKELGLYEESLIIVTADHGESLHEHGEANHGLKLYDSTLRIPLIIKGVGQGRVAGQVRAIDVMPTVLDVAGIRPDGALREQMKGISLLPFARKQAERTGLRAISETQMRECNQRCIRTEEYKLMQIFEHGVEHLYDLRADAREEEDLSEEHPELVARMTAELEAWAGSIPQVEPVMEDRQIDEALLEELRAIGYLR